MLGSAHTPRLLARLIAASVITVVMTVALLTTVAAPAQADSYSAPLQTAISGLPVASEVRTGYDRTLFPHWKDLDGDCQDSRHEVLIAETSVSPTYTTGSECLVATGELVLLLRPGQLDGGRRRGRRPRRRFGRGLGQRRTDLDDDSPTVVRERSR